MECISFPLAETFSEVPILDLIEITVSGFVTAWRFAASPTMISPFLNETTDGVVRFPSGFVDDFAFQFLQELLLLSLLYLSQYR